MRCRQDSPWRARLSQNTRRWRPLYTVILSRQESGQGYSRLSEVRSIGDYGELEHVSEASSAEAIHIADEILSAIAREYPQEFVFA